MWQYLLHCGMKNLLQCMSEASCLWMRVQKYSMWLLYTHKLFLFYLLYNESRNTNKSMKNSWRVTILLLSAQGQGTQYSTIPHSMLTTQPIQVLSSIQLLNRMEWTTIISFHCLTLNLKEPMICHKRLPAAGQGTNLECFCSVSHCYIIHSQITFFLKDQQSVQKSIFLKDQDTFLNTLLVWK